ncbi:hypothetical protein [Pseudovibrio sp. Tun.PSC04-5.I4]|uniref:hypothetical protein n=1 Tax=Pseudovibrio sp. Tun.PSC04-5.I4 TaxID=1798213 RepID=UPI00117B3F90|nr:hypothetical protein [Pseudovibrio sp. Tun.PSC04-5.I4]
MNWKSWTRAIWAYPRSSNCKHRNLCKAIPHFKIGDKVYCRHIRTTGEITGIAIHADQGPQARLLSVYNGHLSQNWVSMRDLEHPLSNKATHIQSMSQQTTHSQYSYCSNQLPNLSLNSPRSDRYQARAASLLTAHAHFSENIEEEHEHTAPHPDFSPYRPVTEGGSDACCASG